MAMSSYMRIYNKTQLLYYDRLKNLTDFNENLAKEENPEICSKFSGPYKQLDNSIFEYYKGHFVDGIPNGFGLGLIRQDYDTPENTKKDNIFVAGNFLKGSLNGNYTGLLYNDCHFIGKANFKEQKYDGKLVDMKNNFIYTGKSNRRGKQGKGVLSFPNGSVYKGDFLNDMKHGEGKITFKNGGWYDGQWKKDKLDG